MRKVNLHLCLIGWLGINLSTLVGCQNAAPHASPVPRLLSATSVDSWTFDGRPGYCLHTQHYTIYTTLQDESLLEMLPLLMEGAWAQYRAFAPRLKTSDKPLECFVFNGRADFDVYTTRNTGGDARIYLMIRKGGYTWADRFVCYYLGPTATTAIAAHEGWHQFAARNFQGRLPPFLEEGLACMFEGLHWQDDRPRWNLSSNPVRMRELHKAWNMHGLMTLRSLLMLHAGDVMEHAAKHVDTFYAQAWAFARFLCEAEGARYRPLLQQWITDTGAGTVFDPMHSHNSTTLPWNPAGIPEMVEHYLEVPLPELELKYLAWVQKTLQEDEEVDDAPVDGLAR